MNNIKEFSHNIGLNWMCGKDARTPVNPGVSAQMNKSIFCVATLNMFR